MDGITKTMIRYVTMSPVLGSPPHPIKSSTARTPLVSASNVVVSDFTTADYYDAIPSCVMPKFSFYHFLTYSGELPATTIVRDSSSTSDLGNLLLGGLHVQSVRGHSVSLGSLLSNHSSLVDTTGLSLYPWNHN